MTTLEAVLAITCGLLLCGWARAAWIGGDTRAALATAQDDLIVAEADMAEIRADRDRAVREVARMLGNQQDDDTVRLPRWQEFLPAQPALPADPVSELIADLERHANGEGR